LGRIFDEENSAAVIEGILEWVRAGCRFREPLWLLAGFFALKAPKASPGLLEGLEKWKDDSDRAMLMYVRALLAQTTETRICKFDADLLRRENYKVLVPAVYFMVQSLIHVDDNVDCEPKIMELLQVLADQMASSYRWPSRLLLVNQVVVGLPMFSRPYLSVSQDVLECFHQVFEKNDNKDLLLAVLLVLVGGIGESLSSDPSIVGWKMPILFDVDSFELSGQNWLSIRDYLVSLDNDMFSVVSLKFLLLILQDPVKRKSLLEVVDVSELIHFASRETVVEIPLDNLFVDTVIGSMKPAIAAEHQDSVFPFRGSALQMNCGGLIVTGDYTFFSESPFAFRLTCVTAGKFSFGLTLRDGWKKKNDCIMFSLEGAEITTIQGGGYKLEGDFRAGDSIICAYGSEAMVIQDVRSKNVFRQSLPTEYRQFAPFLAQFGEGSVITLDILNGGEAANMLITKQSEEPEDDKPAARADEAEKELSSGPDQDRASRAVESVPDGGEAHPVGVRSEWQAGGSEESMSESEGEEGEGKEDVRWPFIPAPTT
jgi:hypothetical protein